MVNRTEKAILAWKKKKTSMHRTANQKDKEKGLNIIHVEATIEQSQLE